MSEKDYQIEQYKLLANRFYRLFDLDKDTFTPEEVDLISKYQYTVGYLTALGVDIIHIDNRIGDVT